MNKPKLQTKKYYDYNDCRNYLQEKYKYIERDYYKSWEFQKECLDRINDEFGTSWYTTCPADFTPEQRAASKKYSELLKQKPNTADFWDFIIDHYDVSNGCDIVLSEEFLEDNKDRMEDWQIKIYGYYLQEFADKNGELRLYVSW